MKIKIKGILLGLIGLLPIAVALLVSGCGETACPLTTQSFARFEFMDSETHRPVTLSPAFDVTGSITTDDGMSMDTLVYNAASTDMSLPLGFTRKTTYTLHYTETMTDVIEVTHKNIPYLENVECDTMMHYIVEDVKYTTNHLDSIVIVNPEITNEEKRNFIIYYRSNGSAE